MKKNFKWTLTVFMVVLALFVSACGGKPTAVPPSSTGEPVLQVAPVEIPTPPVDGIGTPTFYNEEEGLQVWSFTSTEVTPQQILAGGGFTFLVLDAPLAGWQILAIAAAAAATVVFYAVVPAPGMSPVAMPENVFDVSALNAAHSAPAGAPQFTPAELEAIVAAQAATFTAPDGATLVSGLAISAEGGCRSNNEFKLPLSKGIERFTGEASGDCLPETVSKGLGEIINKIEKQLPLFNEGDVAIAKKALDFLRAVIRGVEATTTKGGVFP